MSAFWRRFKWPGSAKQTDFYHFPLTFVFLRWPDWRAHSRAAEIGVPFYFYAIPGAL